MFSQPEVGTVGLTEEAAIARYPSVDIYRSIFKPLHNRVAGRDERMLVKLVVDADTDRVLGFHVVGHGAGEMAQLVGIAVKMRATKADFDATMAVHPTAAEEIVTMRKPAERHRRDAAANAKPRPPGSQRRPAVAVSLAECGQRLLWQMPQRPCITAAATATIVPIRRIWTVRRRVGLRRVR